ncbi:undecaprenyl-phosphate glucose phosphotransferase [Fulvivirgaceae bacterium BMA10]|uniref:Undecaprenyl-phosphate glucose phosphotransferase n=1 Tax=Splendidivirga corallicola TaxID=3051826 RepID=A0ABT8KTF4_9BACT|nr:undecaprenyl-phosphate glucose phosphotransferase [Fulvivirgaceae bacterium BMA10]
MPTGYSKYIKYFHAIGDILLLNISFIVSYYFKFVIFNEVGDSYERIPGFDGLLSDPYLYLLIFFNISWALLTIILKPYKISRISRMATILRSHLTLIILHLLSVSSFWFLFKVSDIYSREQFLITYVIFTGSLFFWKTAFFYLLRIYRKKGFNFRRVVIVGHGELSEELHRFFRLHPEFGFRLLGFFDNKKQGNRILGTYDEIEEYVKLNQVDDIYCCLPYVEYSLIKKLIDFGDKHLVKIKLLTDFRGFSAKSVSLERYDYIPVLNVSDMPLDDSKNQIVKRFFDIIFSSLVIIFIFSWLFPLLAILVKLDSKGPVFFKQKRTGKDGNSFFCYKFRTMHVNNDADVKQASRNDSRITKIGAFLRKTSLDELPQFFNVLIGQMSVVGPRPHMLKHTEEYSKLIEKFMTRHFVKPGITGLAQAKGFRGETKSINLMKNRVKLDRFYIANWSLIFDFKIIFLTITALLKGDENAY